MKTTTQQEQHADRREQGTNARPGGQPGERPTQNTTTPPNKPGQYEEALEQTAETDGQFPENPHGTLDDHRAGEDPVRGNDPNAEEASLAEDEDGIQKVAGLRREADTSKGRRQ